MTYMHQMLLSKYFLVVLKLLRWQTIFNRDVNRVPGPRDPEELPKPGFQTTQKFLRDSKSYSGEETVKKNFNRTDSKHKPKHQHSQYRGVTGSAAINM